MWGWIFLLAIAAVTETRGAGAGAARLVCYVENGRTEGFSECTHLVYTGQARGDKLDALLKEYKKNNQRLKIILRVGDGDKDLRSLLKSKHVSGLEVHDAHRALNRTKVGQAVENARAAIGASGGGPLFLALPAHPELLAKYYDLHSLVKNVDLMMVQTHALGIVKKMTYHPSRLSGVWDMMNTDSVVDLVVGLGVPASKVVISLPATVRQFTLVNETLSTPGSPAVDDEPKIVDQAELCRQLQKGRWTLERDQDLSAPYAFKDKTWLSFEDSSSVDVKGKYARVRGLAGLALQGANKDVETPCGPTLRTALAKVLNQQSRAPRAAVLRSLEHEILSAPGHVRALDALQVSPYRITQVVDSDGVIHSIREDTRTEFSCSRQGYFVHPRTCARFYRCVKFDQLSPDYTVFEFDCPAGLAFDSRYEVCVWPGSLPDSQACPGSSEIAPVPKTRFICPEHEGYYADPENCRWFFACLDHGKAPLTAYEFRCPFGLGFDAEKLKCDWPWLVPACGNIARYEAEAFGYSGAALLGGTGFQGQTADSINIAAHQSLVSGASLDNLVGIQNGYLSKGDALDANFIASQEFSNGALDNRGFGIDHGSAFGSNDLAYQLGGANAVNGLVQPTKYTSGSIILDEYRLPTKQEAAARNGKHGYRQNSYSQQTGNQYGYSGSISASNSDYSDNSGAYVHDPSGDYAEPYKHIDSPSVPYIHDDSGYKQIGDYYDSGKSSGSQSYYAGNNGQYNHDNYGAYVASGTTGNSGSYNDNAGYYADDNSGKYTAGVYRADGHIGSVSNANSGINVEQYHGVYSSGNAGNYVNDAKAYTGSSHTLTAGAVNVGLVGKTTLVDAGFTNQGNYKGYTESFGYQPLLNGHVPIISQPSVSINHIGTDGNNLDRYAFHTTPTSSIIPTTATPIASTTAVYKTSFVPEPPRTSIKQIFGIAQPIVTYVQPTIVAVKQPAVQVTDYNLGVNSFNAGQSSVSSGYDYSKPTVKFEDGISYTTSAPSVVSTFKPQGFSHNQQTLHNVETGFQYSTPVPVAEEPFKKVVAYTTGPSVSTYVQPTVSSFPQSYSHETLHKVENTYSSTANDGYGSTVSFEQPKTFVEYTTAKPSVTYSQQTLHKVDASQINLAEDAQSGYSYEKPSSGYDYPKPAVTFEEAPQAVVYSTASPVVSTYKPQSYKVQTINKGESKEYIPPVAIPKVQLTYHQPAVSLYQNPILKYVENVTPITYVQPTAKAYTQTIHKVESGNVYTPSTGESYSYVTPNTVIQYSTPQPAVVSTYQPHSYSQQTLHNVGSELNTYSQDAGYRYDKPVVKFEEAPKTVIQYTTPTSTVSTYSPASYSHQTLHKVDTSKINTYTQDADAYKYVQPALKQVQQVVQYSAPTPTVSYTPQSYSQQTLHKVESKVNTYSEDSDSGYKYEQPAIKFEELPVQYSTPAPAASYNPSSYSHQTVHKIENNLNAYSDSGYKYEQQAIAKAEEVPEIVQYSTPAPYNPHSYSHETVQKVESNVNTYSQALDSGYKYEQPIVKLEQAPQVVVSSNPAPAVSTYSPHSYSHQTLHKVEAGKVNTYTQDALSRYKYEQPQIKFDEGAKFVTYSTAIPSVSTYQPQSYNLETIHKYETVSSTPKTLVEYKKPAVTLYENPILKFTQNVTPTPVYTQHEISHLSQPVQYETSQQNLEFSRYSYNQPEIQRDIETYQTAKAYSDATLVSNQYYQQSNTQNLAKGKEVVFVSTTPATLAYEEHYSEYESPKIQSYKATEYVPPKKEYLPPVSTAAPILSQDYNYKSAFSFGTSHIEQPNNVNSFHISSIPEIQSEYKAEEYIAPVVSTVTPIVTSTYKTPTYLPPNQHTSSEYVPTKFTTREYLPPTSVPQSNEYLPPVPEFKPLEYLPPKVETTYLPSSTTSKPFTPTTQAPLYLPPSTQAPEYLPPQDEGVSITSYQTGKTNLLGFGTVGPDAGLVSPVTYTTSTPIVSSTYAPRIEISSKAPVRRIRPQYKSTTRTPYIESTPATSTYKAPDYLPPSDEVQINFDSFGLKNLNQEIKHNPYQEEVVFSTAAPIVRKQNIVVQTAKSQLLANNVGSSYTIPAPIVSSEAYLSPKIVSSTYSPVNQELLEVTEVPVRKTKPKVAVVTKINDFNPFLVRKLGAVCSCQSPVLVLKGRRPNIQVQKEYDDYSNGYDYEEAGRGDIEEGQWVQRNSRLQVPIKTAVVSSTFNPIIVPDDSYYQDLPNEEYGSNVEVSSKSTPAFVSTTEKVIKIRPRAKSVTVAPTYKTVLLNEDIAGKSIDDSSVESHSFDRYGPGGWRSRDETLQGSVDCQRAGLFRHPKQCNKFYSCRWDETKNRFTLHVFNCPVQLSFDPSLGACNWPSQGPACQGDTLLTNAV